jgi:hypothetical protein
MFEKQNLRLIFCLISGAVTVLAQGPPSVSQVLMWSTLSDKPVNTTRGAIARPLFSVYTTATPVVAGSDAFGPVISNAQNYRVAHSSALSSALSSNIAVALSVIPLASPTSGVIAGQQQLGTHFHPARRDHRQGQSLSRLHAPGLSLHVSEWQQTEWAQRPLWRRRSIWNFVRHGGFDHGSRDL